MIFLRKFGASQPAQIEGNPLVLFLLFCVNPTSWKWIQCTSFPVQFYGTFILYKTPVEFSDKDPPHQHVLDTFNWPGTCTSSILHFRSFESCLMTETRKLNPSHPWLMQFSPSLVPRLKNSIFDHNFCNTVPAPILSSFDHIFFLSTFIATTLYH